MTVLTKAAARAYLRCTTIAFRSGYIPWIAFQERLKFLAISCSSDDSSSQYARRILEPEQQEIDDEWFGDEGENVESENSSGVIGSTEVDEDFLIYLVVRNLGLSQWHFHQADPDFFPSIPHGHEKGASQPKLDAYLGWVYRNTSQIRRESRKTIIRLWNDDGFRNFARVAINFYLSTHPHYNGWRVLNPRILPKKRKP